MKTISHINNIPLHYARLTAHPYGTRGEQRNFLLDEGFLKILKVCLKEVFDQCPLGTPEVITTAGVFVSKPGQHGHGRAFDLDAIFWQDQSLVTLNFVHQKELYLGIESFLRRHFGIVLNYLYPNHRDHWHIDTSVPVDFNEGSESETLYVQMALKYIYLEQIQIDGRWGPQTSGMVKTVFTKLDVPLPITTKRNYLKFLELTGKIAFELAQRKTSPLQLLDNLIDVVEDLPLHNRNGILETLNSFIDHHETSDWLNGFTAHSDTDIDTFITRMID